MKGKYTTPTGESVEVSNFDAENKIAYSHFQNGESKWCAESEYSTWVSNEPVVETVAEVVEVKVEPPVIEAPVVVEEPPVVIAEVKPEPVVEKPKPEAKPKTVTKKGKK